MLDSDKFSAYKQLEAKFRSILAGSAMVIGYHMNFSILTFLVDGNAVRNRQQTFDPFDFLLVQ